MRYVLVGLIGVFIGFSYGYVTSLRSLKRDKQKLKARRVEYRNSDTPIFDRLMDDFYDVT
jgi:hypothetical protein